jgi:hypothetical protein
VVYDQELWGFPDETVTSARRTPKIVNPQTGSSLLQAVANLTDLCATRGHLEQLIGLKREF